MKDALWEIGSAPLESRTPVVLKGTVVSLLTGLINERFGDDASLF